MAQTVNFDLFTKVRFVGQIQASPSRKQLAFVSQKASLEDNDYHSNLWLSSDQDLQQLTSDNQVSQFIWETEDSLLFSANRSKEEKERAEKGIPETNYYRLPIKGGEAQKAFQIPLSVSQLIPLGEGQFILTASLDESAPNLYQQTAEEREKYAARKKEESYYESIREIPFYMNGAGFSYGQLTALFWYDSCQNLLLRLSPASLDVHQVFVSEDQQRVWVTGQTKTSKMTYFNGVYLWKKGCPGEESSWTQETVPTLQKIVPEKDMDFGFLWEPNPSEKGAQSLFALVNDHLTYGCNQSCQLYRIDLETGQVKRLSEEEIICGQSMGSDLVYKPSPEVDVFEGNLYYLTTIGHQVALKVIDSQGQIETILKGETGILALQKRKQGFWLASLSEDHLPEIWETGCEPSLGLETGSERLTWAHFSPLTHFNQAVEEETHWLHPIPVEDKGTDIQGCVILPPDFDPTGSYPGILDIHGGPRTVYGTVLFHEMQLWAARGFVVFFCNPRGSDGKGDAFADIRGVYGGPDFEDLMAFTDRVLEQYPAIDRQRLGVTGGSYGGFMCNWIVGHTDRFAACATQRSISNWLSFYGNSDIGYFFATDQNGVQGIDQADWQKMWERSPLKTVNSVRTPTLIIHSDQDYRCPLEQGYQWLTALIDQGVESELVLFHGENHDLSRTGKPKGRLLRLQKITAWMEKYLKVQKNGKAAE